MKFTRSWLAHFLDTTAPDEEIAARLTALGLEVESLINRAQNLKGFSVAEILEASPHPNAKKLQVCIVASALAELQIVCGAANARKGLKTILAQEGAVVPSNGMVITRAQLRGVESQGMLCSAEELQLEIPGEGILELPQDTPVGYSAAQALGLEDTLFEIALTPNRGDAAGVYGIARDLAASGLGSLKPLTIPAPGTQTACPISVTIEATTDCPHYVGCYIEIPSLIPSPDWMQAHLRAVGTKPMNIAVDMTNWMSLSFAQPMHVFDADQMGDKVIVRHAKQGEKIAALNQKEYALDAHMLVIADSKKPIAIAGVMGGIESAVSEKTTRIFLESALFQPASVARTGRLLQIESDARYRFERGIDPQFVRPAALFASELISAQCGGTCSALIESGTAAPAHRVVNFAPASIEQCGGMHVAPQRAQEIFEKLGCTVHAKSTDLWEIVPPSWRNDITIAQDLIEEILRIEGYDSVPAQALPTLAQLRPQALSPMLQRERNLRHFCVSHGLHEVVHWSFCDAQDAEKFGGQAACLTLQNPIASDCDTMRPNLLAQLLRAASSNVRRGEQNLALFEIGPVFAPHYTAQQSVMLAGILCGHRREMHYPNHQFQPHTRAVDFFDVKAMVQQLLCECDVAKADVSLDTNTPPWYHPGHSARFLVQGKSVAYAGILHPQLSTHFGLEYQAMAMFELLLEEIPLPISGDKPPPRMSDFPKVVRDLAFVVDQHVAVGQMQDALLAQNNALLRAVEVFDVYAGKNVDEGKKSIALQLTLQADDRTLADADIASIVESSIALLQTEFNARLRDA